MRKRFVYWLDIEIHNDLHNGVLHDIAKPSAEGILSIFNAYNEQKQEIMQFDIIQASEWLQNACFDEPFHSQMAKQTQFLKERLGNRADC